MNTISLTKLGKVLSRNKYVWLVLLLGLVFLLWPQRETAPAESVAVGSRRGAGLSASGIPLDTESQRLAQLLQEIDGVGDARCLLSAEGAVVVCTGGADPTAQYLVTNAVSAYTGLGSDKIRVMKMK